ncbi:hypothetical protein [Streptomyces sp. NPDC002853]
MDRLPYLVADWIALWRDLPRYPRQVVLNRGHRVVGALTILLALLADSVLGQPWTAVAAWAALVVLGPSSLVAFLGSIAHTLWSRGFVWTDLDCEVCGDGPGGGDGGGDDDPGPDVPDGDDDLICEITEYLTKHTTSTV